MVGVFRKLRSAWYRFKGLYHRSSAVIQAWLAGGRLLMGDHMSFMAPVHLE